MTHRNGSRGTLSRILVVVTGVIFLAACGSGGGGTTPTTTPGISLSTTTLTFSSESVGTPSAAQTVTVNSTGTASLVISSIAISGTNPGDFPIQTNTCAASVGSGGNCTISVAFNPTAAGSRSATLTITDDASGSPHTVSLTGTGVASTVSLSTTTLTFATQIMLGTPSASLPVTLNNTGTATLTIASIVPSAGFSEQDNCGGSVNAGGSCTINVTFTPTATGPLNGTLTLTDNSNGVTGTQQTVMLTGSGFSGNTAALNVNFGINGNLGPPTATTSSYYNGIFTTVTICEPGSTTCASVDNILVDTGSIGLRVYGSQLGSVSLTPINDGSGNNLYECYEYGDFTYNWGPVALATVQMGGETASQVPAADGGTANSGVPIQVISATGGPPTGASCLSGGSINDNTPQLFGANGIIGIANTPQDCGVSCTSSVNDTLYFLCSTTTCTIPAVPLGDQLWNPVAAFASADTNGVLVQLPSIPAAGQAAATGSLVFGIGTQTCPAGSPPGCTPNGLGTAHVYALDGNLNFPSLVLQGVNYSLNSDSSYFTVFDTGSNALFLSDGNTLGISDCTVGTTDIGYYCPSSTQALTVNLTDNNGVSTGAIPLSIANALTLFSINPSFAAFNNLGGESGGSGPSSDSFDFGLPFFFGRNVYVGIIGTTPPNGVSAPNGYYAF